MRFVEFLQSFLKDTAGLRLQKHCRDLSFVAEFDPEIAKQKKIYGERISSIMLWGGPGRIVLKTHFDLDTAVAWAAHGLGKSEDEVDDEVAIDFMREFSNLHAGYLRGLFEKMGVLFGISLPFIMSGDSEPTLNDLRGPNSMQGLWVISEGVRQVVCTCEIELTDLRALEPVQAGMAQALAEETRRSASGDGDGEVEFLI